MLEVKTNGDTETYCITFDSDDIRTVLMYRYEDDDDCEKPSLDNIRDIAEAMSDMFDDYFAEWVLEHKED